jgi:hypothetical protein
MFAERALAEGEGEVLRHELGAPAALAEHTVGVIICL